jgi:hypothetical protein
MGIPIEGSVPAYKAVARSGVAGAVFEAKQRLIPSGIEIVSAGKNSGAAHA